MRYAAKVDDNQKFIVDALRRAGCSVQPLHTAGGGVPDLLVGKAGVNYLIEVKDGNKPPSKQKLTPDQVEWHQGWRGQKAVVNCIDSALRVVGAL